MKVSVLDSNSCRKTLLRLIGSCDEIHIAVAWAHTGAVADKLFLNKEKFKSVIVGLHFCATDPGFVDALRQVPNTYVFSERRVCFHPKVYLFVTGQRADAIVGSANLTAGGLGGNVEACMHIRCGVGDEVVSALLQTMRSYAPHCRPVTKDVAASYRRQWRRAALRPRPRSPKLPGEKGDDPGYDSELLRMEWPAFIRAVRNDPDHHYKQRMVFLRYLQTLLAKERTFANLTVPEWKAVAGIVHPDAAIGLGLTKDQIGWFGSMQGSGTFTRLIANRDGRIAKAVDCIPVRGTVSRTDYERFCDLFTSAFAQSKRKGRYPTATRLLAMKRPDVFVCVNKGNRAGLARALDFAPSTLTLENYWERVIEPIQLAEWYNAPRPTGADAEAWDCRAALIDALHYQGL